MRYCTPILILSLFFAVRTVAQTTLSGVVNTYAVLSGLDSCTNTIVVNDATGFAAGDAVLLLQMQGAAVDTDNDASFGNILDLNGVGRYERNRILALNGNVITLANALENAYLTNGRTQVIGCPELSTAEATSVSAQAWNGSTGGVIFLSVSDTLYLSGDLDAGGAGFRGGASVLFDDINCNFLTFNDNFSYGAGNWRGAPKGEGVALPVSGSENGRGALANGGGGGNNHNSGGGGGALHTRGGLGGENNEPSFGGCDGFFPGVGGKELPNVANLLFIGGGGGSGHSNNPNPTAGGNGGGLIVIAANVLISQGGSLLAPGEDGESPQGDGAGGGGAGGTLALDVGQLIGTLSANLEGGKGGNTNNNQQDRCFGPGGGGAGGRLLSTVPLTANLAGGQAGLSINSTDCPDGNNGAQEGEEGVSNTNWSGLVTGPVFSPPTLISSPNDTILCAGASLLLPVEAAGSNLSFQWQINTDTGWMDLQEGAIHGGVQTSSLFVASVFSPFAEYRLRIIPDGDCLEPIVTEAITITTEQAPSAEFIYTVDDLTATFNAFAPNVDQLLWSFGDPAGSTSENFNPNFTYPSTGTYEATLTVSNGCGEQVYAFQVVINAAPEAQFSASRLEGCAPLQVTFTNTSTGEIDEISWSFPGGEPATSSAASPTVVYPLPGTYTAGLTVANEAGSNTSTVELTVRPTPEAQFNFSIDGLTVFFTNESLDATTYTWNFGDSQTSNEPTPVHTYAAPGVYEVTLNAENSGCGSATTRQIGVMTTNTDDPVAAPKRLYPNPSSGRMVLEGWAGYTLIILSDEGRVVAKKIIAVEREEMDFSQLAGGVYWLRLSLLGYEVYHKWVKIGWR